MAVHNEDIAVQFEEIADLLEIQEANPFRVRAYRNAARTVRGLGRELSELLAQGEDLTRLAGIGKDLAGKIEEMLRTGQTRALKDLHRELPASLEDLLHISGLGPRKVKVLYTELGIKTLSQLEKAARAGRVRELDGFGARTEQKILETIASKRTQEKRYFYSVAREHAEPLLAYLRKVKKVRDVVLAGSYRRGRETVGDLDILVTIEEGSPVMDRFAAYEDVVEVVSKGRTRSTVILRGGLQVDLRAVDPVCFGAALHYFTGSKAHNIQIRRMGQGRGLKINEYGVFRGDERIAGKTEKSVFQSVGLPFIPPPLREGRGEIEAAHAKTLPKLVELDDLKGDLHVHTNATDGSADLEPMVRAAKKRGFDYVAITDHTKHLTIAHGLTAEALAKQIDAIDRLNDKLRGITVLKGVEVDILEDGSLDLPDSILQRLDLVIGAVHGQFGLSRSKQTQRVCRAMDHRYFSILAHPSGRLLEERKAMDLDMERIVRHARERGCFLELNAQPQRMDLDDTHCRLAKEEGVLVCINSDAHGESQFEDLTFGINQAQRGWLRKEDVLNSRPLGTLRKLLRNTMT
ncbi:MAG: DNA polymerase/3'-5' exonuclease PolX [Acidiferrobacteraceae bacterium]|jgi:DNA polymerase (family 10)